MKRERERERERGRGRERREEREKRKERARCSKKHTAVLTVSAVCLNSENEYHYESPHLWNSRKVVLEPKELKALKVYYGIAGKHAKLP